MTYASGLVAIPGVLTAHTPALDIDVMHQEAAEYVEDLANYSFDGRGTFLLRYGNKPKRAILFRTETPFAKRQVRFQDKDGVEHKVEFLGDGQQLVVAGVHPDTHQPYAWEEFTPWDIAHEDLPLIDEAQVDTFLAMVAEGLVADFGFTLLGGQAVNGQDKPADKAISPGNIHNGQVAQIASLIRGERHSTSPSKRYLRPLGPLATLTRIGNGKSGPYEAKG